MRYRTTSSVLSTTLGTLSSVPSVILNNQSLYLIDVDAIARSDVPTQTIVHSYAFGEHDHDSVDVPKWSHHGQQRMARLEGRRHEDHCEHILHLLSRVKRSCGRPLS